MIALQNPEVSTLGRLRRRTAYVVTLTMVFFGLSGCGYTPNVSSKSYKVLPRQGLLSMPLTSG
jgi:hypothetical protein